MNQVDEVNKGVDQAKAIDEYLGKVLGGKKLPIIAIVVVIFVGCLLNFAHNSSPAPFLDQIMAMFGLDPVADQSIANLSMSIMFAGAIPAVMVASILETKIGTWTLLMLAFLICGIGVLLAFASSAGLAVFIASRVIYGVGFGFILPGVGSAMMKWFRPKGRQFMATMNGFFPLLGALIGYTLYPVIATAANSWQFGYASNGIVTIIMVVVWITVVRKRVDKVNIAEEEDRLAGIQPEAETTNNIAWIFKQRDMWCVTIAFICDFAAYMYIATILPMWLANAGGMSMGAANTWAAIAFPLFGVIGTVIGAALMTATGKRKFIVVGGQILKFVGILIAVFGADKGYQFIIVGIALFGIGNGGWMPPLFIIPTELKGTNASRAAAGFSMFNFFGWTAGCLFPAVGGAIATAVITGNAEIMKQSQDIQLAYGYKWSMLVVGLIHIVAIIFALLLHETGPGRKPKTE